MEQMNVTTDVEKSNSRTGRSQSVMERMGSWLTKKSEQEPCYYVNVHINKGRHLHFPKDAEENNYCYCSITIEKESGEEFKLTTKKKGEEKKSKIDWFEEFHFDLTEAPTRIVVRLHQPAKVVERPPEDYVGEEPSHPDYAASSSSDEEEKEKLEGRNPLMVSLWSSKPPTDGVLAELVFEKAEVMEKELKHVWRPLKNLVDCPRCAKSEAERGNHKPPKLNVCVSGGSTRTRSWSSYFVRTRST